MSASADAALSHALAQQSAQSFNNFKNLLRRCDRDRSDTLELHDVHRACRQSGVTLELHQLTHLIQNGRVSYPRLEALLAAVTGNPVATTSVPSKTTVLSGNPVATTTAIPSQQTAMPESPPIVDVVPGSRSVAPAAMEDKSSVLSGWVQDFARLESALERLADPDGFLGLEAVTRTVRQYDVVYGLGLGEKLVELALSSLTGACLDRVHVRNFSDNLLKGVRRRRELAANF